MRYAVSSDILSNVIEIEVKPKEKKMTRHAVAYTDFYNNDLQIKIVEASSWRKALVKAFPVMGDFILDDDLEKAREDMFNSDVQFNVVKINKE